MRGNITVSPPVAVVRAGKHTTHKLLHTTSTMTISTASGIYLVLSVLLKVSYHYTTHQLLHTTSSYMCTTQGT